VTVQVKITAYRGPLYPLTVGRI